MAIKLKLNKQSPTRRALPFYSLSPHFVLLVPALLSQGQLLTLWLCPGAVCAGCQSNIGLPFPPLALFSPIFLR